MRIAIYGKGGIGKSTMSANLSASLAGLGLKVLQVGCDPKHDSTRLLLGGNSIPTVVQYLRTVPEGQKRLGDVMFQGDQGVACIEAGGPEPGIGCAGRGILSAFELLEAMGIGQQNFDVVIYDVLGDVVCGGFAVPLRRGYADAVILVTSGEYMSIFAANNILRGIRNFDGEAGRVLGIILNARGDAEERDRAEVFADAVRLPLISRIPRSRLFSEAERKGKTIRCVFPGSRLAKNFDDLAGLVMGCIQGRVRLHKACPLSDEDLEALMTGKRPDHCSPAMRSEGAEPQGSFPASTKGLETKDARWEGASAPRRKVLTGCAFSGAVATTAGITDALTIMHGPRSCAHIVTSVVNSIAIANQGKGRLMNAVDSNMACSGMGETAAILGGKDDLRSALRRAKDQKWQVAFVVTTCPSGIIGEDIGSICSELNGPSRVPRIIPLDVEGDIHGGFAEGVKEAYLAAMGLVDDDVSPADGLVNVIGEKPLASNREYNFLKVRDMLERIGFRVNCRFIGSTTVHSIQDFKRAGLNLMAYDDADSEWVKTELSRRFGGSYIDRAFPVGLDETASWIRALAKIRGKEDAAEELIAEKTRKLEARVENESALSDKEIVIVADKNVDWLLDVLFRLEVDAPTVIVSAGNESPLKSRYASRTCFMPVADQKEMEHEIERRRPDLVLSSRLLRARYAYRSDIIPVFPEVGFDAEIKTIDRLARIMRLPLKEGWREGVGA